MILPPLNDRQLWFQIESNMSPTMMPSIKQAWNLLELKLARKLRQKKSDEKVAILGFSLIFSFDCHPYQTLIRGLFNETLDVDIVMHSAMLMLRYTST